MYNSKNKKKDEDRRKEQNEYEKELEKSMRDGNFNKIIFIC